MVSEGCPHFRSSRSNTFSMKMKSMLNVATKTWVRFFRPANSLMTSSRMVRSPELVEQLLATRRESPRFVIDHAEVGKDAHDIAESVTAETRPDNHARGSEDTPIGEETQGAFQAVPH